VTLAVRLILLVVVAVLPALAVQLYTVVDLRRARERQIADLALRQAELIHADLTSIADGARQVLAALATIDPIRRLDPACGTILQELRRQLDRYQDATLFDAAGRPVCATDPALAKAALPTPELNVVLARGAFAIGRFQPGGPGQKAHLPFAYPIRGEGGEIEGVLRLALSLDWLGRHLDELKRPPNSTIVVADRDGIILARYPDHAAYVGKPFLPEAMPLVRESRPGNAVVPSFDGRDRVIGYHPPAVPPFGIWTSVGFFKPDLMADIDRATWRSLTLVGLGGLLALAAALVTGGRMVRRPAAALAGAAARWQAGDLTARVPVRAKGRSEFDQLGAAFNAMVAELDRTLAALKTSLAERDMLLKELNHRVKNNLQLVTSLLKLQGSRHEEPAVAELVDQASRRIAAIAAVHGSLYQGERLGSLEFSAYLRELCERLVASFLEEGQGRVRLAVKAEPLELKVDQAIPLGLIVNELVTNAFKHGFAQGGVGTVRIRLQPLAGETWRLEVVDEVEAAGEGPPLELAPSSGLGMQLVEGFARQLGGTVQVERAPRFRVLVDLPLRAEPGLPP
jgi:two-component sensor histidine kinase